jgi:hypothetical protein
MILQDNTVKSEEQIETKILHRLGPGRAKKFVKTVKETKFNLVVAFDTTASFVIPTCFQLNIPCLRVNRNPLSPTGEIPFALQTNPSKYLCFTNAGHYKAHNMQLIKSPYSAAVASVIGPALQSAGLSEYSEKFFSALGDTVGSGALPMLNCVSPSAFPPREDYPSGCKTAGYCHPNLFGPIYLPDPVLKFLDIDSVATAICLFWNDVVYKDYGTTVTTALKAMKESSTRCIIINKPGTPSLKDLGVSDDILEYAKENIIVVDNTLSIDKIIGKSLAIIHTGSAFGCSLAMKCGTPQIITPVLHEQFQWGHIMWNRIGIALKPIPLKTLNAKELVSAITTLKSSEAMFGRAEKMKTTINGEKGSDKCAEYCLTVQEKFKWANSWGMLEAKYTKTSHSTSNPRQVIPA